jgi:hypothetical protein
VTAAATADRLLVVSHFPGRLRVRAETFRVLPEVADEVATRLAEESGVSDVKTSRITGSMVILYQPRELQLPELIQLVVRIAGLHGVQVDAPEDGASGPSQGTRVRRALSSLNDSMRGLTANKIDLRTAVPGALATGSLTMFLLGRRRIPEWYDLAFWAFVTFSNLNPQRATSTASDHGESGSP